jgi:uncharacterized membrane protein YdjX (TVP38/TMEM64 family)
MRNAQKIRFLLMALAGAAFLALALGAWLRGDLARIAAYVVSPETPPLPFLLMLFFLPLVGFPISVFLVLLGVKFGAATGVLLMLAAMPVHLLVSFLAANSLLRSFVRQCLAKMAYRLPQIPEHKALWFSVVFMAVPGLPYTVKNYTLPLAGAPFRPYFLSGYLVQGAMGIPFVVAGNAASGRQGILLGGVLIVIIAIYVFVRRLRKRHARLLNSE